NIRRAIVEGQQFVSSIKLLKDDPWKRALIDKTGKDVTIFLNRLPALHNTATFYDQKIKEVNEQTKMEVTDDILKSPHSKDFDQAKKRMHTIKDVMDAT
ncbi:ornithine carbamoyltransferase, partial [Staphylococcus pseudintermedius]